MVVEALVSFRTPDIGGRDELGRFLSAQRELYARNARFADTMRADLGRRIENQLLRPGQSTGRLVRASAHHENVRFDAFSVGIGVTPWLDKSAQYWRTIEEGSAAVWSRPFIGTPLAHSSKGRTSANLVTTKFRTGKGMVVQHEIAPMHIYAEVFRNAHLDEYGVRAAQNFLRRIFSEDNLRVR